MKYKLLKSIENSWELPLISEETDSGGKMEQVKLYFENHFEITR